MTRLSPYLYVDRRGPDEKSLREALEANPVTAFGERDRYAEGEETSALRYVG